VKHDRDKSLILQLREASVGADYKHEQREEMRAIEDKLVGATNQFLMDLNSESLTVLTSLWSRAVCLLDPLVAK
jgi:hypothetical protein